MIDQGEEACGHCGETFSFERPARETVRRQWEVGGAYDYPETHPWHADCIERVNAELQG